MNLAIKQYWYSSYIYLCVLYIYIYIYENSRKWTRRRCIALDVCLNTTYIFQIFTKSVHGMESPQTWTAGVTETVDGTLSSVQGTRTLIEPSGLTTEHQMFFEISGIYMKIYIYENVAPLTIIRELSWCQLCRYWWLRRLPWQPPIPPVIFFLLFSVFNARHWKP